MGAAPTVRRFRQPADAGSLADPDSQSQDHDGMNDRMLHRARAARRQWVRPARVLAPLLWVGATAVAVGAASAGLPEAPPLPGRLVYTRATASTWDLYASDADGGNELRLTSARDVNPVGEDQPRWSPDGREIVFTTLAKDGDRAFIWRVPFAGGTPAPVATANAEGAGYPAWDPRGEAIVFAGAHDGGRPGDLDLKVWSPSGARTLTNTADRDEREPDWSPDGGRIVYASRPSGDDDAWWVLRSVGADGTDDRPLWEQPGATARNPRWSPDGRHIAFVTYGNVDGYGRGTLTVLDVASGATEAIVGGVANPASWSPDGGWLLIYNTKENGLEPPGQPTPTRDPGATQMLGLYLVRLSDRALFRLAGPAGGAGARVNSFEWGQVSDWTRGTHTPTPDAPPTETPTATPPVATPTSTATTPPTRLPSATPAESATPTPDASATAAAATRTAVARTPEATATPPAGMDIYLPLALKGHAFNGTGARSRR